ncbi:MULTISPECIES: nuclease A inhibitor family protein [unclassified Nostoc]|uniref:nuclease A inhibitor family protein n=1 Tax=unclassified Nostoc TaxID=2593658 RepID=UPI002AD3C3F7|nr:nuclease A inhibitor family protein [Nostoc sp. DedQUE03]MDZ7975280.1 nuclease A inhibitor family protein [Nostoc sp. DedQUE03]MDZ8048896.1 nuclease A inhibitor family protein [Nostoc sp. DedQUE02]
MIIVEPYLTVDLPGHEDGGTIVPFVWDVSEQGEFNVINLCLANGWLQLTDVDKRIKSWQKMEYAKSFYNFYLGIEEENIRKNQFEYLLQIIHTNLQDLESFLQDLGSFSWMAYSCSRGVILPGLVIGRTVDGTWICICPTVYKETEIPQELIYRSPLSQSNSSQLYGQNTLNLISQIEAITSELGIIYLEGDLGGGYYYNYEHQIVYGVAVSKELADEQAFQKAGLLELKQFHSFFPDKNDLGDYYEGYKLEQMFAKYEQINNFFKQTFSEVIMYRFSFFTQEHIYIIRQSQPGDWVGLYLKSEFVYNT